MLQDVSLQREHSHQWPTAPPLLASGTQRLARNAVTNHATSVMAAAANTAETVALQLAKDAVERFRASGL